jgi:hypothetical protein
MRELSADGLAQGSDARLERKSQRVSLNPADISNEITAE